MKNKKFYVLLILALIICTTACSKPNKLKEIAQKVNNCETVKHFKEYDYIIKSSVSKNELIIKTKSQDTNNEIKFKLKDNILSNENLTINDLVSTLLVIDGVGQTYGYKDGELSKNINAFPEEIGKYTLSNEGLELKTDNDKVSVKIDLTKKIPLIDINKFYLKTDDFDIINDFITNKKSGNQSGKSGNIAYDVFIAENENTITIGQEEKLGESAYKSILSALEVIYGKETADHFKEIYPEFTDNKTTIEAFTIDPKYKPEDQEDSIFKNTKVILITIDNDKI